MTGREMDWFYAKVDTFFKAGNFEAVNFLFEVLNLEDDIDIGNLSIDFCVTVLTSTLCAKSRLQARSKFFEEVKRWADLAYPEEKDLLKGLE